MRIGRALVWVYPALLLGLGVGFEVWSLTQSKEADTYRGAPQCGSDAASPCYELFSGQIKSVDVSQTRSGEQDAVVIDTPSHGALTATLEPSAAAAPHIRTGNEVTVKLYRGQVTLVEVDGFAVPSTANPAANQGNTSFTGWLLTGLGILSLAVPGYALWRRRRVDSTEAEATDLPDSQVAAQVLPSGNVGWAVRPRLTIANLGRYAVVGALLLVLTYRALLDPARSTGAILLDAVVIFGMIVLVGLFLRNDRLFADSERIGKTNLLGRTSTLLLRDVKRADRFSVANRGGRTRHLVFVGPDGRKAFEVAGLGWDYRRLDQLCRAVGIELTGSYDDVVSAFGLNQRVPGSTRWGQQLAMGLALIVLIVAVVVLLSGPGQR